MTTANYARGRIVKNGMGGFLNPPTHPEHSFSIVTTDGQSHMSLSSADTAEWLDPSIREEAASILNNWQRPDINNPEVQKWIRQVLGYFRNCYRGNSDLGEKAWHAGNLEICKGDQALLKTPDQHAGVHLIRKFYPDYQPTAAQLAEAKWGS